MPRKPCECCGSPANRRLRWRAAGGIRQGDYCGPCAEREAWALLASGVARVRSDPIGRRRAA